MEKTENTDGSDAPKADQGLEVHERNPPPASTHLALPPDDAQPVTADRGVLKKVLVQGQGDPPPQFSRCLGAPFCLANS